MRALVVALATLLLASTARAEEVEAIAAGRAVRRTTRGDAEYAVYAPRAWRPKLRVPLVVHVPVHQRMPFRLANAPVLHKVLDAAAATGDFNALYAVVLLESHNKENRYSARAVDPDRYLLLLERDAGVVAEVVEAIAAEASVDRDAVFIVGKQLGAEAALGVAVRKPDLFAGVVLRETESVTSSLLQPEKDEWFVLPEAERLRPATGLHVLVGYDPTEHNGDVRVRMAGGARALLERTGFRHVEELSGARLSWNQVQTPGILAWMGKRTAERRVRREKLDVRDALLEKGARHVERGRLTRALSCHAKAHALEAEHDLDAASAVLYADLETRGRALLAEAAAAPPSKRKAAYRKVAKLFAGLPLGVEAQAALDASK